MKILFFLSIIALIFLTLNKLSRADICGNNQPQSRNDCFNLIFVNTKEDNESQCCMLYDKYTKFCYNVNITEVQENKGLYLVDNKAYNVDCMNKEELKNVRNKLGQPCGNYYYKLTVNDENDCFYDSKSNNPCCYFHNDNNGFNSCFFLGKLNITSLVSYDKTKINCYGFFLQYNIFNLLLIIFLLFSII